MTTRLTDLVAWSGNLSQSPDLLYCVLGSGLLSGTGGFAITQSQLVGIIQSGQIGSGQIGQFALASGVGGSALTSGQVTSGYLGNGAVVSGSVASGSISQFAHASGAINSGHLASGAVYLSGGAGISITLTGANGWTITNASGAASALTSGQVTSGYLGNGSVVSGSVASGVVNLSGLAGITVTLAGANSWNIGNASGSFALTSGCILSGMIGNGAVVSGSLASGSVSQFAHASGAINSGHLASGAVYLSGGAGITLTNTSPNSWTIANASGAGGSSLTFYNYITGYGLSFAASQQLIVTSGYALDKSGTVMISQTTNTAVFCSGTRNGAGAMDATNIGAAALVCNSSGANISGYFMSSGYLWPVRSGTGLIFMSGLTCTGGSGTDFLNQVAVGDLVGTWKSGFLQVTAVNSGLLNLATNSVQGVSGAPLNIIENAFIGISGRACTQVFALTEHWLTMQGAGFSGNVSGLVYIGGQPNTQIPLHVWTAAGLSGTTSFLSTQRTNPLVSGMVGYCV